MGDRTPTHILHLASGDLWAGAEMQLFTLVRTLSRRDGVRISVILLNHGELERKLQAAGVAVTVIDENALPAYRLPWAIIARMRQLKPDIVHTHRFKENILGGLAGLFCGRPGSLRTTHGAEEKKVDWWRLPGSLIYFLDWFSGRFLQDRVIAVSDELSAILARSFPEDHIEVVLNGIDVAALDALDAGADPFGDDRQATLHIGLVGRLVPVKRVDLFIRIARQITEMRPDLNCRFHVIGDGPLRDELEQLGRQLDTAACVRFEGHQADIYPWIRHLDQLVMCSDHEGLPMVLLEAMAMGTPVVAHAVGGITRLLDDGACGALVHNHTVDAYIKEILALADDPDRRRDLLERARARVATVYSAERNADAIMTVYSQLLARQSAS